MNVVNQQFTKGKQLMCPHCRKTAFLRRFKDSENFYLWAIPRDQEHRQTDRMMEEDYYYFVRDRVYIRRVSWLADILSQMGNKRYSDER